jgi:hypothetical protein
MIEKWLQITCDGCGETETNSFPNETNKTFREFMAQYGWKSIGKLDYCRKCNQLKKGKA